jgi:putative ABC transport system permease protein
LLIVSSRRLQAAIVLLISDRARSTTCVISSGLLPALRSSKTDLQSGLKDGGLDFASGHQRTQRVFMVLQIALTLILLSGGGLLFRTIHNLWGLNPGFDPLHIITFQVGLSPSVMNTPFRGQIPYQQLVERIRQI